MIIKKINDRANEMYNYLMEYSECRFLLANFQLKHILKETSQANMEKPLTTLPINEIEAYNLIMTSIKATSINTSKSVIRKLT